MRRGIETVPRDGKVVILEDDARGTYELAHWSAEQRAWVGEDGKPIPIAPTHWHSLQRDEYLRPEGDEYLLQREAESRGPPDSRIRHILPLSSGRAALEWPPAQEDVIALRQDERAAVTFPVIEPRTAASQPAWRRFVVSSIAAAMIASSLIGMYFRAPIAGYVTQYADQHDIAWIGRIAEQPSKQAISLPIEALQQADSLPRSAAVGPQAETDGSSGKTATWTAVQVTETRAPEAIGLLEKERRRADGLEIELAELRRSIEGRELRLRDAAATAPQSQEPDREKPSALLQDLAAARQELKANEVQYRKALAEERDRSAALTSELATAQRNVETQVVLSNKTGNEAAQLKKAADTAALELQRERERAGALASELATARQDVETLSNKTRDDVSQLKREAATATTELEQSLQLEHERAEALASELAKVRREVDAAAAVSSQKDDEAVQLKRKAETATAELQQSLQQEHQRAETLSSDLDKVRREVAVLSALSSKKDDEATQLKRAAETTTAQLQQSLQQQRDKIEALESDVAKARENAEAQVATSRKTNEEAAQTRQIATVTSDFVEASPRQNSDESASIQAAENAKAELRPSLHQERGKPKGVAPSAKPTRQVAGAAATEQPVSTEAKGSEAAGLLARAKALLGQGNIGAARVVLERAAETGSAQATFALAETYDPNVLLTWRTYGTRGDVKKARELYARAYDGGIKAAKDRSDALIVGDGGRKPASWFGREEADH
jgi:hypothetical protein